MRAFTAIADYLHFRHAAESLGITQPALSQQLAHLEAELGLELVVRTSRQVSLTPFGEQFLESCRRTLAEVDRATEAARDAANGASGRIVIGCLGAGANGPLPDLIRAFRRVQQRTLIELRHFPDSSGQERDLISGTIDLAVVRSISNDQFIESRKLLDEPFIVYVPTSHALSRRSQIGLSELADEDFVLWPRDIGPAYYDLVIGACQRAGFTPRLQGLGNSLEAQLGLVAAGVGVSPQAASNISISREKVVKVRIDPADLSSPLWLAWRRWQLQPSVRAFLDVTRNAATPSGSGDSLYAPRDLNPEPAD